MSLILNYESECKALRIDSSDDGSVTIVVPTRRTLGRFVAKFVCALEIGCVLAPILIPFLWLAYRCLARRTPRAVIQLTPVQLTLTETDDGDLGLIPSRRSWPTHFIGEIRKCRYRNGMYVRLPMRDMLELLADVDVSVLDQIMPALQKSLERVKGGDSARE